MISKVGQGVWMRTAMFVPPAPGKKHWTTKTVSFTIKMIFAIDGESVTLVDIPVGEKPIMDAVPQEAVR